MKIIKTVLVLTLCVGWIFITNISYKPINSIGSLLTYKTGLLSIPLQENGIKELKGEYKPKIYIDSVGVPHIYGNKEKDVAFGLGYMHAKDRYFQMEMITRTVQGEVSEIFAEETIESDIFWKPYEFKRKSKELLEDYKTNSPEFYNYLIAYAQGINAYIQKEEIIDPMYKILGKTPREWKPEYSMLVTWYMSWSLSYFDYHMDQHELLTKLSDDDQNYFYPMQPKGLNTILPSEEENKISNDKVYLDTVIAKKSKPEESNPLGFHPGIGSNNWAVNAIKTKNGKSILANDPHLFLTLPEAFYEIHMVSDKLNLYGFSIPGVPVIVSGHNDQISWGITNGEWDLIDRYRLKTKDDNLYFYDGKWIPFEEKEYSIKIKGEKDRIVKQKNTVHGKVVQDDNGAYYAQRWYASDKSYSIRAMYDLMQSENWDGFTNALKEYGYPPQNFIYTDINDNIGIVCAGKLPDRGINFKGELLDGTLKYEPKKSLDTLWRTYNPDEKLLFSANQQPIQNDTYFGTLGYKDDYRVNRIHSLLKEKDDWDLEKIQEMQKDEVDISFFEFKELLKIYQIPENYKELLNGFSHWNGDMKGDSHQALIYELLKEGVEQEAMNFAESTLKINRPPSFKYFVKYLKDSKYTISDKTSKQELFNNILQYADSTLQFHHGNEWKEETYKNMSSINVYNISFLPGFGERIVGAGGNENTININSSYYRPVFRAIYEMENENINSYTILAGGQSGKINSIHYKDQLKLWEKGTYKKTQFENNPNRLKNIKNIIKFK
ncbi:penicillin acylase family protein [Aquimarina sp. M1]